MLQALSTPRHRRITLALLGCTAVLGLGAAFIGIDDNPPGLALLALAGVTTVVTFVHPWRRASKFLRLAALAIPAFIVLVVVHNLLGGLAALIGGGPLQKLVQAIDVVAFLGAIVVCPAALLVGVVGALSVWLHEHWRSGRLSRPAA